MTRSLLLAGVAALGLAGCAEDRKAPYDEIAARAYVHDGAPALTIYSVLSTRDGSGAHSALMVNASQRVLFDPAGSFQLPSVPERGDVQYGFTPRVQNVYIDFHARQTYDVVEQTITVSSEVAARALSLVQQNGAVSPARCTSSIVAILRQLPGFENIAGTPFPKQLYRQIAQLPGVTERRITDDDADDNHGVLFEARDINAELGI